MGHTCGVDFYSVTDVLIHYLHPNKFGKTAYSQAVENYEKPIG